MLEIDKNRKVDKYSLVIQSKRIVWWIFYPFFRFSLRSMFGWRRFLLTLFGARVGKHTHVYNSATIYMPWNLEIGDWSAIGEQAYIYNLGKVIIGSKVTISQRAYLCAGTHDYTDPSLPLLKLPIEISDQAWIATDAFVGPGVKIGEGVVVGARAVVVKDVKPWVVVVGNPARQIKTRTLKITNEA